MSISKPLDDIPERSVPSPPVAAVHMCVVAGPQGAREDPYYWLRDDTRSDPRVLAHLEAETAYAQSMLAPCQPLMDALYQEMIGRMQQDDTSVPVRYRGFWYSQRLVTGGEYPLIVRRPDLPDAVESVLLDCNLLAQAHAFFQLGGYDVSPDGRLLAYTQDVVGRRQFSMHIKDLVTGELLPDAIENVEPGCAWTDDNRRFLYVEKDPVTLRGRCVRAHLLGTPQSADPIVYEELDASFDLTVERSKSEVYLFIGAESTSCSEWRYARSDDTLLRFEVIVPRIADHEYEVEHLGQRFVIRTNLDAQNFRIVEAPVHGAGDTSRWRDLVAHDPRVFIHDYDVFRNFLAVGERSDGLRRIRVQTWNGSVSDHLAADDPAYVMWLGTNLELDTDRLRYVYSSLTTPTTVYELDVSSRERTLLKRDAVLGDFAPTNYASEFIWVPARDGERIPVSLVYRKGMPLDGSAPLYLYGYGAYGLSMDPVFDASRLSLLDRGFVYAIAHVRGGQELGRRWYEAGRLQHKWNTFHDFIDVTDGLVEHGYGAHDKVFAVGGSAGGLLIGVLANVAAHRYAGLIAHVPFVDVVTTMLDKSIPLTTLEYEEWGNPNERTSYEYMLSYSPYDNVRAQQYPPMLVTTGLWDSQVQYFEPVKWVARLRAQAVGKPLFLLHVDLTTGHGGKSGRFAHLYEVAREYAFILHQANDSNAITLRDSSPERAAAIAGEST
ncbi:peptidase [Steroidobacter denitrificans]|uniref:Peptidase n=1 Tax=Steroidobacter denitrificans TaxID=465721 RepID=A0A127FEA6_STEDE|nr:S9 family peptidase [Steroidobacter denitrificans]AMN48240.1 peptidase [Steroidobacter denitrificans]